MHCCDRPCFRHPGADRALRRPGRLARAIAVAAAIGATGGAAAAAAAAPLTPLSGGRGVKFAGTLGANGFAGDGGSADNAQFANPLGLAVDAGGNLLIADASNSRIRRIDTTSSHVIRTVAGNGSVGFAAENAPATSSPLPLSRPRCRRRPAWRHLHRVGVRGWRQRPRLPDRSGRPDPPIRRRCLDHRRLRRRRRIGDRGPNRLPRRSRHRRGRQCLHRRGVPDPEGEPGRDHHHLRRRRQRRLLRRRRPGDAGEARAAERGCHRRARQRVRLHWQPGSQGHTGRDHLHHRRHRRSRLLRRRRPRHRRPAELPGRTGGGRRRRCVHQRHRKPPGASSRPRPG